MLMEARAEGDRMSDALRLALVTADPDRFLPAVFPESVTKKDIDESDIKESEGTWKFIDETITPEMAEQMFAGMVQDDEPHPLTMQDVDQFGSADDDW